jgi:hypothetical protein
VGHCDAVSAPGRGETSMPSAETKGDSDNYTGSLRKWGAVHNSTYGWNLMAVVVGFDGAEVEVININSAGGCYNENGCI